MRLPIEDERKCPLNECQSLYLCISAGECLYLENERRANQAAMLLGKLGGKVKSEAKAAAARENGKKGGRPAKEPATEQK